MQLSGVELAAVHQLTSELGLDKVVPPPRWGAGWLNASLFQGVNCCLKAGIVAPVDTVIVAAIDKLALGTRQTLLRFVEK
jgi:hypothetical protein